MLSLPYLPIFLSIVPLLILAISSVRPSLRSGHFFPSSPSDASLSFSGIRVLCLMVLHFISVRHILILFTQAITPVLRLPRRYGLLLFGHFLYMWSWFFPMNFLLRLRSSSVLFPSSFHPCCIQYSHHRRYLRPTRRRKVLASALLLLSSSHATSVHSANSTFYHHRQQTRLAKLRQYQRRFNYRFNGPETRSDWDSLSRSERRQLSISHYSGLPYFTVSQPFSSTASRTSLPFSDDVLSTFTSSFDPRQTPSTPTSPSESFRLTSLSTQSRSYGSSWTPTACYSSSSLESFLTSFDPRHLHSSACLFNTCSNLPSTFRESYQKIGPLLHSSVPTSSTNTMFSCFFQPMAPFVGLATSKRDECPIVIDTGASTTLTPFRSDFIEFTPCQSEINAVGSSQQVQGHGIVEFDIIDMNNIRATIRTHAILCESSDIRLFSPQQYFQECNDGLLVISKDVAHLTSPHLDFKFPFHPSSHLPVMLPATSSVFLRSLCYTINQDLCANLI